jgi:hypothetical protein
MGCCLQCIMFLNSQDVNDTGDKHQNWNISAKFLKISKWPKLNTQGPGVTWFMKKPEFENLLSGFL